MYRTACIPIWAWKAKTSYDQINAVIYPGPVAKTGSLLLKNTLISYLPLISVIYYIICINPKGIFVRLRQLTEKKGTLNQENLFHRGQIPGGSHFQQDTFAEAGHHPALHNSQQKRL
jgi:hypothetical protein